MKILNETLLDLYRGPGLCEKCMKPCSSREVHHIFAKGTGSAGRMDIPINLISLGSFPCCDCHAKFHTSSIGRDEFLKIVAAREGLEADKIEATLKTMHSKITKAGWLCFCEDKVQVGRNGYVCWDCGRTT